MKSGRYSQDVVILLMGHVTRSGHESHELLLVDSSHLLGAMVPHGGLLLA